MVFKEGQEVKVLATRVPIYAHHGYVETMKETRRTLIIDSVLKPGKYHVVTKGKFRKIGGVRVPMRHILHMIENHEFGTMRNQKTKYEIEVL